MTNSKESLIQKLEARKMKPMHAEDVGTRLFNGALGEAIAIVRAHQANSSATKDALDWGIDTLCNVWNHAANTEPKRPDIVEIVDEGLKEINHIKTRHPEVEWGRPVGAEVIEDDEWSRKSSDAPDNCDSERFRNFTFDESNYVQLPGESPMGQASEIRLLDPDMPAQELRLHMGEMTAQEERTTRAAIRWANATATSKEKP